MPRTPYHHGNLREALILAGLQILAEQGLGALTLRGCAARVGVSHAAPKNHFSSLEALQAAIVAEGFRRLQTAMREPMAAVRHGSRHQITAACEGYLRFAQENPDLFRLMFSTGRFFADYPELSEATRACYDLLREVCGAIAHEVDGTPAPPTTAEIMLWSFVHGYTALAINGQFRRAVSETGRLPSLAEAMPRFPIGTP